MNKKLIVVGDLDGSDRESASVFYCSYLLVKSETLKFDEEIFDIQENFKSEKEIKKALKSLGYEIEDLEVSYCGVDELE